MDSFSVIQQFFTQMQCPHCGQHLHEHGVQLLKEENGMFLVHVECSNCYSDIGNAMVGVETSMSGMMRRHANDESSIRIELDSDDHEDDDVELSDEWGSDSSHGPSGYNGKHKKSKTPPRFAGAAGLSSLRRRYQDPELTPVEKERLSRYQPVNYDDVLDAHAFFNDLGRDWQHLIPEEMRQSHTASTTESAD
jgi:hypothetical protein